MTRTALGKGLGALISQKRPERETPSGPTQGGLIQLDVGAIVPSPHQPRRDFSPERLHELAQSIASKGLIQPVIVRAIGEGRYELIAGERRWRAAKQAQLPRIPAVVRSVESSEAMELAFIENIQREDLNPIETALGYQQFIDTFDLSHEEVAARVGKDRSTVTNHLRLLLLPEEIQREVAAGTLSMGHARAILAVPGKEAQLLAARNVIERGLSVRETERLAKRIGKTPRDGRTTDRKKDIYINELEDSIRRILGTKVTIRHHGGKGVVELHYYSPGELDRIVNHLRGKELP